MPEPRPGVHRASPRVVVLTGTVRSGQQAAGGFIAVPWVRDQLSLLLGVEPFAGTLNLQLRGPPSLGAWRRQVGSGAGRALVAVEPGFCDSTYFPVVLSATVRCGVLLPHVSGYPDDVVELVAGVCLRDRLGLRDGDAVSFEWENPVPESFSARTGI